MTTGERKWFAETEPAATEYFAARAASYPTSKPIRPCRSCAPGGASASPDASALREPQVAGLEHDGVRVTALERGFVAHTPHRVTFTPSPSSPAHGVREELRRQLSSLRPTEGETLHAVFTGAIPSNSDVENQLIYNVFGSRCAAALTRGVRLELNDASVGSGAAYCYEIDAVGAPFRHWHEEDDIALWDATPLADGPTEHLLSRTWWALRKGQVTLGPASAERTRFGLRLSIHMPADGFGLTPERLKKVVDGTVSAFQRHAAPAEAAARIARRIRQSPADVTDALQDSARAVLGAAEKPVGLTVADVQWNPDDTRLVAAEVEVRVTNEPRWLVAGRAFPVVARPSHLT